MAPFIQHLYGILYFYLYINIQNYFFVNYTGYFFIYMRSVFILFVWFSPPIFNLVRGSVQRSIFIFIYQYGEIFLFILKFICLFFIYNLYGNYVFIHMLIWELYIFFILKVVQYVIYGRFICIYFFSFYICFI
jgi:hypothetical protein